MPHRRILLATTALAFAAAGGLSAWYLRDATPAEIAKLAQILDWRPGSTVAEIGAGHGRMALDAADRVGPTGQVYATEINPQRLAEIRQKAAARKLSWLTAVQGAEADSNLPARCCESIFMRGVYHHFTHPAELDATLFRALKPGGLIAVIDFPPSGFLGALYPVKGVPKDRKGHGIPEEILIAEMKQAGFELVDSVKDWPGNDYCMLFRKPRD